MLKPEELGGVWIKLRYVKTWRTGGCPLWPDISSPPAPDHLGSVGGEILHMGGVTFHGRGDVLVKKREFWLTFIPTFWNFLLILNWWLGQNDGWRILWKDNLRTKASLGISWARASSPQEQLQKKFCQKKIYKSGHFQLISWRKFHLQFIVFLRANYNQEICLCICVCIYICVCICVCIYICVCISVCIYICVFICVCIYSCVCICVCIYICVCIFVCICTCICVCICICISRKTRYAWLACVFIIALLSFLADGPLHCISLHPHPFSFKFCWI